VATLVFVFEKPAGSVVRMLEDTVGLLDLREVAGAKRRAADHPIAVEMRMTRGISQHARFVCKEKERSLVVGLPGTLEVLGFATLTVSLASCWTREAFLAGSSRLSALVPEPTRKLVPAKRLMTEGLRTVVGGRWAALTMPLAITMPRPVLSMP
jgi:hypothetical protein